MLEKANVKNNQFMLALFDATLVNVDPHSTTLTDDEKMRITTEILRSPWYFIREVIRVPVTGGTVSYILHLGNLFLTWCMISNINAYLLLPRQNYKTMSACAIYLWIYCFGTKNSHFLFFNKELRDAQNNLKRTKDLMEGLPEWIRYMLVNQQEDRNAIEYIYSANRANRIDPKPAATSTEHADLLGRSNTVPNIWYDEIAFAKFIREIYMAAVPAQSEARSSAIKMNVPYGTVITTTPNSQDHPSGEFAYMIRGGALHFRLEFYDYGPSRVRKMIDEQAEFNFLYAEYQYYEIGRSEEWFKEQCRELLQDQTKIKRELLLVWPMSTDGSVFAEEQLDVLLQYKKATISTLPIKLRSDIHIPSGLEILFTEIPDPNLPYIVSIDTAGGVGLDYTAFTISHPDDMRQIGTMRTNTADNDAVCAISVHIVSTLFPRSIIVIERNYLGVVLISHLLKVPGVEQRMFYLEKEKDAERVVGKITVRRKSKVRVYGVDTTTDSREAMFRHLFQIVDELPRIITSAQIQNEIRTLHRKKTGKIEHRSGFHDDQLMSWLIAMYADRHEQPVLRTLIARQRGSNMQSGMINIAALNTVGVDAVSSIAAHAIAMSATNDVTVDSYTNDTSSAKVKAGRRLASMVSDLNSSFNPNELM